MQGKIVLKTGKSDSKWIFSGIVLLIVFTCVSLFIGTESIGFKELIGAAAGSHDSEVARRIFLYVRIPRTAGAVVCGAALSCSGLLLQESLHNPLASPGVIGVNGGAGLFVLISALIFPYSMMAKSVMAFAGAFIAVLLVYAISVRAGSSKSVLILSGVAVSSLASAGSNAIITVFPETVADKTAFSLGGLQNVQLQQLLVSAAVIAAMLVVAMVIGGGVDLFALGDEVAEGLGLNVKLCRLVAIISASALAAAAVSICGLLGFVGLLVPNLLRGTGQRGVRGNLILCMLYGAAFLLLCDVVSRTAFYPYELPAGVLLSAIGAPFFIYMIVQKKWRGGRD